MSQPIEKALSQIAGEIATLKREVNRLKLVEVPTVTVWTDWTPTVTQSGSVTVTVTHAKYIIIRNMVTIRARLAVTGTGTAGNTIIIGGLPSAISPASVGGIVGVMKIIDAGTGHYVGSLTIVSATTFQGNAHNQASPIGTTPSFALASGDTIDIIGTYEKA